MTKFILDSGDADEYREIADLAKEKGSGLWGGTTNPSLIAKKLAGQKVTPQEAIEHQKEIILELTSIVTGAVSAEVYADMSTTGEQMAEQGREIATWHERVVVKLPTTIEGFKARTILRGEGVPINNTLVFSQEQIFAICLHEQIIQSEKPINNPWPPFISPFVGRLDDLHVNGMDLVEHGMAVKNRFTVPLWMLEASVRSIEHFKKGLDLQSELITAPAKVYREWFGLTDEEKNQIGLEKSEGAPRRIPQWEPSSGVESSKTIEDFMELLESGLLNINHPMTDKGILKFNEDWSSILA